jgi:hypothetical protein
LTLYLLSIDAQVSDPVWPLPLTESMRGNLKSSVADLVNAAEGQGGAITAALYLQEFVTPRRGGGGAGAGGGGTAAAAGGSGEATAAAETAVDGESEGKGSGDGAGKEAKDKMVWVHVDMPGATMGLRTAYAFVNEVARS